MIDCRRLMLSAKLGSRTSWTDDVLLPQAPSPTALDIVSTVIYAYPITGTDAQAEVEVHKCDSPLERLSRRRLLYTVTFHAPGTQRHTDDGSWICRISRWTSRSICLGNFRGFTCSRIDCGRTPPRAETKNDPGLGQLLFLPEMQQGMRFLFPHGQNILRSLPR